MVWLACPKIQKSKEQETDKSTLHVNIPAESHGVYPGNVVRGTGSIPWIRHEVEVDSSEKYRRNNGVSPKKNKAFILVDFHTNRFEAWPGVVVYNHPTAWHPTLTRNI